MKSPLVVAAAATAVLAVPAGAQAATIAITQSCVASGEPIAVTGSGFTPNAFVTIGGDAYGSGRADAAGGLVLEAKANFVQGNAPKAVTMIAEEGGVAVAQLPFNVVREPYMVDANLNGNPRSVVRWRFAGFPNGPVYGHFRLNGRTVRNHRFGTASGPCGTLSVRARRLPTKTLRYGTYRLKFDGQRSYSASTPGRLGTLSVFRTFRRG